MSMCAWTTKRQRCASVLGALVLAQLLAHEATRVYEPSIHFIASLPFIEELSEKVYGRYLGYDAVAKT